jgi:hypothetical protein
MTRYLGGLITKDESLVIPANNFEDTSAPGVWTLEEAQALNKQGLWPTAGVSNPVKFVENIFSIHEWNGTNSDQSIANGIDLQNNDGLVWIKNRNNDNSNVVFDSKRGSNPFEKRLHPNEEGAEHFDSGGHYIVPNSNGNGFTTKGNDAIINSDSSYSYISWTWRATPKFFDVVTYTGDGSTSGRQIAHSLGSAPGMIIFKRTDAETPWIAYHRSIGETKFLYLSATDQAQSNLYYFNNTAPTSTHFTLRNNGNVNASGGSYVAYLFGHDTSSDGMIQCGSYTGDGGSSNSVNLGFEPQWIMIKASTNTSSTDNWVILDNIRGIVSNGDDERLYANTAGQGVNAGGITLTPNGFYLESNNEYNSSGATYIYMAIRRGPMATPTSRASVLDIQRAASPFTADFPTDLAIQKNVTSTGSWYAITRLAGATKTLQFQITDNESSLADQKLDSNTQWGGTSWGSQSIGYSFRRAPGFFDVVTYDGNGSNRTINHNLGVVPDMIWIKLRSSTGGYTRGWVVTSLHLPNATATNDTTLYLNTNAAEVDEPIMNDTGPTSTVFSLSTDAFVNNSSSSYVAYLFANLAGISKVGTFSHTNGSSTDVDCGFSSGSSFVIVKRTDSTGDWYVWDSARGIVSGNDSYMTLNADAAEVTNTDYIDPLNSGFQIASGFTTGSYFFYAIAA